MRVIGARAARQLGDGRPRRNRWRYGRLTMLTPIDLPPGSITSGGPVPCAGTLPG